MNSRSALVPLMLVFAGWSWPWSTGVESISSPAGAGSWVPRLSRSDDALYMSWMEPLGKGTALYFSRWTGGAWSAPRVIASEKKFFLNWADFPSITALEDGTLLAHWLEKSGSGVYDYVAPFVHSQDGGRTWSKPDLPHREGDTGDHGFVSVVPMGGGRGAVIWLDARQKSDFERSEIDEGEKPAQALYASFFDKGKFGEEILLDGRVCDCCQTTAVRSGDGVFAAYRDRSADEVRDMGTVRFTAKGAEKPGRLFDDGWKIKGCPVNGPFAAAEGEQIAIAWYTMANKTSKVNLAFSEDGGRSFGPAVRIDEGNPEGRVAAALLADGSAAVSWLERRPKKGKGSGEILVRRVSPAGKLGKPRSVAMSSIKYRSGFPQMVRMGDRLVFAWTELVGKGSRVRLASLPTKALR